MSLVSLLHFDFLQKDLVFKDLAKLYPNPVQYLQEFHRLESAYEWDPEDQIIGKSILGSEEFFTRIEPLLSDDILNFKPIKNLKLNMKAPGILEKLDTLNDRKDLDIYIYALKEKTALKYCEINDLLRTDFTKQRMSVLVKLIKAKASRGDPKALSIVEYVREL